MMKRIISMVITLMLVLSLIPAFPAQAATSINIGDYVQMGSYYGEPILWRCVDIDATNGPLMLADKILTIKAFDAKGIHKYMDGTTQADTSGYNYRTSYGSNLWETSNIRSWLNSTATAGNVPWPDGCPPTATNLWNGYNAYDQEKGFMADGNFTASERSIIKSVTQKSLINSADESKLKVGGTTYHSYSSSISTVVQNYDTAYYHNVTDKMFLLDVKQLDKVYQNRPTLGTSYYIGQPTQKAVDNSSYKSTDLAVDKNWYYWLRSSYAILYHPDFVRSINAGGYVSHDYAFNDIQGVRPAFYINLSSGIFKSGTIGTLSNPYIISLGVIYDNNGSTGGLTPNSKYYAEGETVTVAANAGNLTRTGYTFGGWNTKADGSGITYVAGTGTFNIGTEDVILYAKWDSNACDVMSWIVPAKPTVEGLNVSTVVYNQTKSIAVDAKVSLNASWKLYSDANGITEIANKTMTLAVGENIAYIKVTAEDGVTKKIYKLTITRNGIIASNTSAKPGEKAKIDITVADAVYTNYFEFTVIYDSNSLSIDTTDANSDGLYDAISLSDYKVLSHTPITEDIQDSSKKRITIAVQYDNTNGYPTTEQIAKLASINFDVKTTSPIGITEVEILNNTAKQNNCYGVDKDSNLITLNDPKAGNVEVIPKPVISILIEGTDDISANKGTANYTAQILPSYATNKKVDWSVSDTAVASIDDSGVLTPITNGTVEVIATASDGSGVTGRKTVNISGQKAFLSSLTMPGIFSTPFLPYITEYNIYVPLSTTSIAIKPTFDSGALKNNGMIWANNFSKTFSLTTLTTTINLDLTQPSLDPVTYTVNVIKTEDGFIGNNIGIYNGSQKIEAIPQDGGEYTIKVAYGNNSTQSNSTYYIIAVTSNKRLISTKIVPYTFAPGEVYTFENEVFLPSSTDSPNLEIKAMLWKDINTVSPYLLPLSISR